MALTTGIDGKRRKFLTYLQYDHSPRPDNILAAGNSYLFRAVINENSVSFGNVSVKDWTDVDESGNPLYPIQD